MPDPIPNLAGLRVLLTRPAENSAAWREAFAAAGATVIVHPTVEVVPPPSWEALDEAFGRLGDYDWLVFTSAAAARFSLARLPVPPRSLARPRVAAVGAETARVIEEHGLVVALIPEVQRQEGLVDALGDLRPGTRVLFPQAIGGREGLRDALLARGCIVDVVPASQTIARRDLPAPPPFDVATFASPSALRAFVAAHGLAPLQRAAVAVIGPTTGAAASALGLEPLVAPRPSADALIRTLADAGLPARSSPQGAA
jgi:uroporphyrinogen III methyltransferase/synthase